MASKLLEEVTKNIKSILTTSTHGTSMTLRQLADDYDLLVGKEIPFLQLNHPSLTSFLRSINNVVQMNKNPDGPVFLSIVAGKEKGLNNIMLMVQEQNNRSKKKVASRRARPYLGRGGSSFRGNARGRPYKFPLNRPAPTRPPGTPLRTPHYSRGGMPSMKPRHYGAGRDNFTTAWEPFPAPRDPFHAQPNSNAKSNNKPLLATPSLKPLQKAIRGVINNSNQGGAAKKQPPVTTSSQIPPTQVPYNPAVKKQSPLAASSCIPPTLKIHFDNVKIPPSVTTTSQSPALQGHPTFGFNPSSEKLSPLPREPQISEFPTFGFNRVSSIEASWGVTPDSFVPPIPNMYPAASTNPQGLQPISTTSPPVLPSHEHLHVGGRKSSAWPSSKRKEVATTDKDYRKELEDKVAQQFPGEKLVFRVMTWGKTKQLYLATVNIGKLSVSTYPDELPTRELATQNVAMKALEELAKLDIKSLPISSEPDVYLPRVKQLVLGVASGGGGGQVWHSGVETMYEEAYQEKLPEKWLREAGNKASIGLNIEKLCDNRYILSIPSRPSTPVATSSLEHEKESSRPPSEAGYAADDNSSKDGNEDASEHGSQAASEGSEHESQPAGEGSEHGSQAADEGSEHGSQAADEGSEHGSQAASEGSEGHDSQTSSEGASGGGGPRLPPLTLPPGPYWDVFVMYIEDTNRIFLRLAGEEYSVAYDNLLTELELFFMEDKNLNPVESPLVGAVYAANHDESWFRVKVQEMQEEKASVLFVDHGDSETIKLTHLHHLQDRFFQLPAQCVQCCLSGLEYAHSDQTSVSLLQSLALGQTLVAQVIGGVRAERVVGWGRKEPQPLVLYNTNGDDDININEKIIEHLAQNFPEPKLPQVGGIAEVYLVHVTGGGDVFVRVETSTSQMLDNLLELARNRTEEILGESAEIDLTRLYLARFGQDGEWYRGAPRSAPNPDGKALRCQLHNVPRPGDLKWTYQASQRLVDLAPNDATLLLKVVEGGRDDIPPQVELFKRLQPQNELVSLNATLLHDDSVFNDDDNNNNETSKDIVISPSRTRSRQSSSNSQGFNSGPSSLNSGPDSLPSSPRSPLAPPSQVVPAKGEYYDVVITYAASPENFAVQSWKQSKKLDSLVMDMQVYYKNTGSPDIPSRIPIGEYYAVQHHDGAWYRAYVNMVEQDIVTGKFVDYGDCFLTSRDNIRELQPSFCKLPCQAIKAKLHGVEPLNKDWTIEDTGRFQGLVEHREFVSGVMDVEKADDGTTCLMLLLVDTNNENDDVYIHQLLIDEGRAKKKAKQAL